MQSPKCAAAGFGTRLVAYLIDMLLITVISAILLLPLMVGSMFVKNSIWNRQVLFHWSVYAIAAYCIRAVYLVIFTYAFGKTPGKMLLRIRVETLDGEKLTFLNVLFRETVGRFLSGILYIGYLIALSGKDHFALHDMLCDTRVAYENLAEMAPPADKVRKSGEETMVMPHVYHGETKQEQQPTGSGYVMPQRMKREQPTADLWSQTAQEGSGNQNIPREQPEAPREGGSAPANETENEEKD